MSLLIILFNHMLIYYGISLLFVYLFVGSVDVWSTTILLRNTQLDCSKLSLAALS